MKKLLLVLSIFSALAAAELNEQQLVHQFLADNASLPVKQIKQNLVILVQNHTQNDAQKRSSLLLAFQQVLQMNIQNSVQKSSSAATRMLCSSVGALCSCFVAGFSIVMHHKQQSLDQKDFGLKKQILTESQKQMSTFRDEFNALRLDINQQKRIYGKEYMEFSDRLHSLTDKVKQLEPGHNIALENYSLAEKKILSEDTYRDYYTVGISGFAIAAILSAYIGYTLIMQWNKAKNMPYEELLYFVNQMQVEQ